MSRAQEMVAAQKRINAIAQANKPAMVGENTRRTLAGVLIVCTILGLAIIAKIAGL